MELVRDFQKLDGPGPVQRFNFFVVTGPVRDFSFLSVRVGPIFLFLRPWSELVLDYLNFPVWDQPFLVRGYPVQSNFVLVYILAVSIYIRTKNVFNKKI